MRTRVEHVGLAERDVKDAAQLPNCTSTRVPAAASPETMEHRRPRSTAIIWPVGDVVPGRSIWARSMAWMPCAAKRLASRGHLRPEALHGLACDVLHANTAGFAVPSGVQGLDQLAHALGPPEVH